MPGDCTYILAQDIQDGNFSVVANFNKGNLVSVTVTEPKESITLKNNGNVSLFLLSFNQFPIATASYAGEYVTCIENGVNELEKGEREREKGWVGESPRSLSYGIPCTSLIMQSRIEL